MQLTIILRIIGMLLMIFSVTTLPPIVVSLIYSDSTLMPFVITFLATLLAGLVIWFPVRNHRKDLRLRDGFVVVVIFWTVLGLTGALPFMLSDEPQLSLTDAVFESMSGLTTTGATVITESIDTLPPSILFYRQQLQWLGGMGIIVLAVAILPLLGVGGMQLYRAETPGPMKDSKLTPRITETAKALWYIYLALTILCALAYWAAGMSGFDAITHSFSTVAIGGFSTHDASIGYFNSPLIEMVAVFFMLIAGMNFALHFLAWRSFSVSPYYYDTEVKVYLGILATVSAITVSYLYYSGTFDSFGEALHQGIFQTVSIGTTTGYTTTAFYAWPGFLPVLLLLVSFIGGCAGSTGGGMKVIRILLLFKQGSREVSRLLHPNAQIPIKIGGKVLPERVVEAVWGFFSLYIACFIVFMLIILATGEDQITAFSAVAACMNNLGPGLGEVGAHFGNLSDTAKWVLSLAMLMGRLEVFTLLVLLSPAFWRH